MKFAVHKNNTCFSILIEGRPNQTTITLTIKLSHLSLKNLASIQILAMKKFNLKFTFIHTYMDKF